MEVAVHVLLKATCMEEETIGMRDGQAGTMSRWRKQEESIRPYDMRNARVRERESGA